ncbi:MAG: type II toxin-antitoxin system VapC family toxin [Myxococcota bacterium]|nr:type II toxin-antitoxin system VapC family toxin [Myxococcota bacterium]
MTTPSDAALLDTNILVYAADSSAAHHSSCLSLLERGDAGQFSFVLTPQILAEFIAVVTNPNGLSPIPREDAYLHVEELARTFPILVPTPQVVDRFLELLRATKVSGKRSHDVLHAATMLENGVSRIYTYDRGFTAIPGITVLTP